MSQRQGQLCKLEMLKELERKSVAFFGQCLTVIDAHTRLFSRNLRVYHAVVAHLDASGPFPIARGISGCVLVIFTSSTSQLRAVSTSLVIRP